jgi:hypothetical protein
MAWAIMTDAVLAQFILQQAFKNAQQVRSLPAPEGMAHGVFVLLFASIYNMCYWRN